MTATEAEMRALLVAAVCGCIGIAYDDLYRNKSEWNADRGRRHDINFPFQSDVDSAVNEIMDVLRSAGWGPLPEAPLWAKE